MLIDKIEKRKRKTLQFVVLSVILSHILGAMNIDLTLIKAHFVCLIN